MNVHLIGRVSILILVVQLGACANMQQANLRAKQQEARQYCEGLYADSRLDPIRRKAPVDQLLTVGSMPVEMMAIAEFPTDDEAKLILKWAQNRQDCQEYVTKVFGPPPAHLAAMRMANSQAIAELYARRITYGQLAGQINQNQMAFLQQDQALRSQAQRDTLQAQQAFSQQLFQQQQLNLQRQQLLNQQLQQYKPLPSNNSVNCMSQYIGNIAYTNCH
jgi:hypothetical protein